MTIALISQATLHVQTMQQSQTWTVSVATLDSVMTIINLYTII